MFYFDEQIEAYEERFEWDLSLLYLESRYLAEKNISMLNALVGYSWLYLVEGPIISGRYENDDKNLPLEYWKKYMDVGKTVAFDNSCFNFIAGYSLVFNGEYWEPMPVRYGYFLMEKCASTTDNPMLKKLAQHIIDNAASKKYIFLEDGDAVCKCLFNGHSLLDKYFCEVYRT